jgi:hypothetical protein
MNTDDIEILKYDISVYHNITIFTVLCEQRLIEPFVVVVKMIASQCKALKRMKNCDLSSTLCILQIELLYLQTIDYHACTRRGWQV